MTKVVTLTTNANGLITKDIILTTKVVLLMTKAVILTIGCQRSNLQRHHSGGNYRQSSG